ncbi:MAG TPA: aldo/keto reductase [Beijerinckiaceae bacterium]|nr:aldo/keto reductase [Beijerinckiaceae bacterium]
MHQRNLGRSGLLVSAVGLGGNNFGGRVDAATTRAIVHAALDLGITFFDTADTYGRRGGGESGTSEIFLGEALGARRKDIVLASKFGHAMDAERKLKGASRRYIISAAEASLKRLKTDWLDLYQLHGVDPSTPVEETMRALDDLVHHGKVRYIGCSNLPAWRVVEAAWTSRSLGLHAFISCQDEYSLLNRSIEAELVPAAQARGLGILPFYPLASGLLTGKYKTGEVPPEGSRFAKPERFETRFQTDATTRKLEALRSFAEQRGHTLLELAISWLAGQKVVGSVMAGATSPEQIRANAAAANWHLSPEDYAEIDKITLP